MSDYGTQRLIEKDIRVRRVRAVARRGPPKYPGPTAGRRVGGVTEAWTMGGSCRGAIYTGAG
jgi:hypothetical protein